MSKVLNNKFAKKFAFNLLFGLSGLIILSGTPTIVNGTFFQKGPSDVKAHSIIIQPVSQSPDMAFYPTQYAQPVYSPSNSYAIDIPTTSYYATSRVDMGYNYNAWPSLNSPDMGYNYPTWTYPTADMGYNYNAWP